MRIGIDLQTINDQPTGIGKYCFNLAQSLLKEKTNHELVFFVNENNKYIQKLRQLGAKTVPLPQKKVPFYDTHVKFAKIMKRENLDLLHGPANTIPLFFQGKTIITLHDLAIYAHPEWFPKKQWLSKKIVVPNSLKTANKIITPSNASKNDIVSLFNIKAEKITVIAHGVDECFFDPTSTQNRPMANENTAIAHEGGRYILFVGTMEPRKNLVRLIEAYARLPKHLTDTYILIIAGKLGWQYKKIQNTKIKMENDNPKLQNKIKFIDYLSDKELPHLLRKAKIFIFPSLFEGFGMPILEAMAAGTPVITSNTSSMPEVAGNAALMVNPYSVTDITEAIKKILTEDQLAQNLIEKGRVRAKYFSWTKCARLTLNLYNDICVKGERKI